MREICSICRYAEQSAVRPHFRTFRGFLHLILTRAYSIVQKRERWECYVQNASWLYFSN